MAIDTVAATIARHRGRASDSVRFHVRSGETLTVHLPARDGEGAPDLQGPVHRCCSGQIDFPALSPGEVLEGKGLK